jgi:hypothetical protein
LAVIPQVAVRADSAPCGEMRHILAWRYNEPGWAARFEPGSDGPGGDPAATRPAG